MEKETTVGKNTQAMDHLISINSHLVKVNETIINMNNYLNEQIENLKKVIEYQNEEVDYLVSVVDDVVSFQDLNEDEKIQKLIQYRENMKLAEELAGLSPSDPFEDFNE